MKYTVQIENKPFTRKFGQGDDILYSKTAIVNFIDDLGTVKTEEYGVIDMKAIRQKVDLGEAINLDFCYIEEIDLGNCTIKSFSAINAFFHSDANFESAIFNGHADFNRATFDSEVSFFMASFKTGAGFMNTVFMEKVDFYAAKFEGCTSFVDTTFVNEANFSATTFNSDANFSEVNFNGDTSFDMANFGGEAEFYRANFKAGAGFSGSIFSGGLNFKCKSSGKISWECAKFLEHVNMRELFCEVLDLSASTVEKTLDLRNAKIGQLSLKDLRNLGAIFVEWQRDNVERSILNYTSDEGKKVSHWDLAVQFRLLKENFKNLGQYDDEDAAYVTFRRQESLSKLLEENKQTKGWRITKKGKFYFSKIKDLIGEYGTNPFRIVLALLLNILLFGMIYWLLDGVEVCQSPIHPPLCYFYFSAITSFTVGYGDLKPVSDLAAFLACLEAFFGVFLMSYFIVAFSRKVLR